MRGTTPPSTDPPGQLSQLPIAPGRMPLIGHTWSLLRRPSAFLESLRTLGPIVRMDIGKRPVYMVTRPELAHMILITEARRVQRGGVFFDLVREDWVTAEGLGTFEGEFDREGGRRMQPLRQPD